MLKIGYLWIVVQCNSSLNILSKTWINDDTLKVESFVFNKTNDLPNEMPMMMQYTMMIPKLL